MPRLTTTIGIALALLTLSPIAAQPAEPEEGMNRVWFQVERTRDVENDWMTAVLGVNEEDPDPAALAERVNTTMTWALERAKGTAGIEVRSGGYHTHPVEDRARIRRWRARQDLILEAHDFPTLSRLVGELQTRLQLHSVSFSVSPTRRRSVEDELIAEALAAYRARAEIVQSSFAAKGYELVDVTVNTGGPRPVRPMLRAQAMAAEATPPALEGGSSTLTVTAAGRIQLH